MVYGTSFAKHMSEKIFPDQMICLNVIIILTLFRETLTTIALCEIQTNGNDAEIPTGLLYFTGSYM